MEDLQKKVFEINTCVNEVIHVLEKHNTTVGDMEKVLETVKETVLSSTLVQSGINIKLDFENINRQIQERFQEHPEEMMY